MGICWTGPTFSSVANSAGFSGGSLAPKSTVLPSRAVIPAPGPTGVLLTGKPGGPPPPRRDTGARADRVVVDGQTRDARAPLLVDRGGKRRAGTGDGRGRGARRGAGRARARFTARGEGDCEQRATC